MYKFFTAALVLVLGAQAIQIEAELEKAAAKKAAPFPAPKSCGVKPKVNPLMETCSNKIFAKLDKDGSGDVSNKEAFEALYCLNKFGFLEGGQEEADHMYEAFAEAAGKAKKLTKAKFLKLLAHDEHEEPAPAKK